MKQSLDQQIQAVREARKELGGRWGFGLDAAVETLNWFRANETALRCVAGSLAAIKKDPAVRAVLATWPGATIVAVREAPVPGQAAP